MIGFSPRKANLSLHLTIDISKHADALQKLGVQPIESVGKAFDPRLHEAVEMVDTAGAKDHEVLDEFQRGYQYKGRLLRPAMVRVARNSSF